MELETVVVVAGGHPSPGCVPELPEGAHVIAADSGVDRALALGLRIDRAIGDFDSVSTAGLAAAEAAGAVIERHPAAKDATDLELALDAAIALEPSRILVIGSAGGRLDHLLGSILLLGDARYATRHGRCVPRRQPDLGDPRLPHARRARPARSSRCSPSTARPKASRRAGSSTRSTDETLPAGTSRGVSNVFAATEAHVTVARGCLIAVQPGPEREESL